MQYEKDLENKHLSDNLMILGFMDEPLVKKLIAAGAKLLEEDPKTPFNFTQMFNLVVPTDRETIESNREVFRLVGMSEEEGGQLSHENFVVYAMAMTYIRDRGWNDFISQLPEMKQEG